MPARPSFFYNAPLLLLITGPKENPWSDSDAALAVQNVMLFATSIGLGTCFIGMARLIENAQLLARATRAAVAALGLEVFAPQSPAASVTAVKAPAGVDSGIIVKEFRNRFGAIIANGQGSMKGQIFRIAHLGYFDFADVFAILACLEIILNAIGFPVKYGTGVAAAQQVYAQAAQVKEGATA